MAIKLQMAEDVKTQITKQQQIQIANMYKGLSKQAEQEAMKIATMTGVSEQIRYSYLKALTKRLNKEVDSIMAKVNATTKSSMQAMGEAVVQSSEAFMQDAGMSFIKGAFSHIPTDIVESLVSGKVYKGDWEFSKALWQSGAKVKADMYSVVAAGVAGQKDTLSIAKDLEKYLNPSSLKPWDWKKVYPNISTKVDYSAQRLARTLVQHAYQLNLTQVTRYNPFITGIKWHSAFIHGRTCELCKERDGTIYPKTDLPFDHPNGLCYFTSEIPDSPTQVADRIADWYDGKPDPYLDLYALKGFGAKAPAGSILVAMNNIQALEAGKKLSKTPLENLLAKEAEEKAAQKLAEEMAEKAAEQAKKDAEEAAKKAFAKKMQDAKAAKKALKEAEEKAKAAKELAEKEALEKAAQEKALQEALEAMKAEMAAKKAAQEAAEALAKQQAEEEAKKLAEELALKNKKLPIYKWSIKEKAYIPEEFTSAEMKAMPEKIKLDFIAKAFGKTPLQMKNEYPSALYDDIIDDIYKTKGAEVFAPPEVFNIKEAQAILDNYNNNMFEVYKFAQSKGFQPSHTMDIYEESKQYLEKLIKQKTKIPKSVAGLSSDVKAEIKTIENTIKSGDVYNIYKLAESKGFDGMASGDIYDAAEEFLKNLIKSKKAEAKVLKPVKFNAEQDKWLSGKGYTPEKLPSDFTEWSHTLTSMEKTELFDKLGLTGDAHPFQKIKEWYEKNIVTDKMAKANAPKPLTQAQIKQMAKDAFSTMRKDHAIWAKSVKTADDELRDVCKKVYTTSPENERRAIYEYTQSYSKYNEPLRGYIYGNNQYVGMGNVNLEEIGVNYGGYQRGQVKKLIDDMTRIIEKSSYNKDFWVQRGVEYNGMDKFFGINPSDFNIPEADLKQKLLGKTVTDGGFFSTGVAKGKGFSSKPIILNTYAPQGTKMMYAEPFSAFGNGSGLSWKGEMQSSFGGEAEMILQRGTSFRVTKVEQANGKWYIDMEVVAQPEYK